MAGPRKTSLMVPQQGDEAAGLSLILEMLRGLSGQIDSQNSASTEDRKLIHDIHMRVVQIESNQLQRRVEEMAKKVDLLEADKNRRQGVVMSAEWAGKFGPYLAAIVAAGAAILAWLRAR